MANYTKTTNFTAKDSLPSGNAAKKILGSLFDTEFNNISTAIATKANLADTTFTGSTTLAELTLASGATVTAVLDEDDMASNSATAIVTQQSTKAYVLSVVTDIGALLVSGTPAANDFAKFTSAAEIVGRSYAETRADLSLEVGTDVQAYDADTAKLDAVQTFTTTQTWTKGADVASATELPLVTDGNYFDVTGTATATSFANLAVGTVFKLHFDGAMVLTNNADIVCLSGANVTTSAGDEAEFVFFDTGKVRMTNYARADGTPLVAASAGVLLSTVTASTSSEVDIETTFDSTYDKYVLEVSGLTVSNDGVGLLMRMKIGGSYITSSTYMYVTVQPTSNSGNYDSSSANDNSMTGNVILAGSVGNASSESFQLTVKIPTPSSTAFAKHVSYEGSYISPSTNVVRVTGSAVNTGTAALTGIRFYASAGTILAGKFRLYGIVNS